VVDAGTVALELLEDAVLDPDAGDVDELLLDEPHPATSAEVATRVATPKSRSYPLRVTRFISLVEIRARILADY
jgi:hypothetical protein